MNLKPGVYRHRTHMTLVVVFREGKHWVYAPWGDDKPENAPHSPLFESWRVHYEWAGNVDYLNAWGQGAAK